MLEVYVGIGSNDDAARRLAFACEALEQRFGPLRISRVYRSAALGFDGPDFLNRVAAFATRAASPAAIAAALREIERAGGRTRPATDPRRCEIDLDLLLYGQRVDASIRIPRADVLAADFLLAPLAEIAPRLRHPVTGSTMTTAWSARAAAAAVRVEE